MVLNIRIASPPYIFLLISDRKHLVLRMYCMPCTSSTQNERPRQSHAYPFVCARSARTTIRISKKVFVGDSLRSTNQQCQLLAPGERKYLEICKDSGQMHTQIHVLMIRKSFERPCPMKMQPRSTRSRNFLYTTFSGVRVYRDNRGSRSPTAQV